ncbi:helix-hairpin-helix domain-containing protein [uncultured Gemella sp.]|uniref:helix-hairpin-helix domain-containing protein n=1 Tax=uncultured Gemella sp. TaxID=254352 RepID=UPI0028D8DAC3|nr:helix-hairpin-helix domain-containing protein [uncultured Gemella sp.]
MKNEQAIELLGPDWEKVSEIILKYHEEINNELDKQSTLTQVIYLDKAINNLKFIFNLASDMNVNLEGSDWGRALIDIFSISVKKFKEVHKYTDSLKLLLLIYLVNPSNKTSIEYEIAELCVELGRYDVFEEYFQDTTDLELLMAGTLLAIMIEDEEEARVYFERLREEHRDVALFFGKDYYPTNNIKRTIPKTLKNNDEFFNMLMRYKEYLQSEHIYHILKYFAKNPVNIRKIKEEKEKIQSQKMGMDRFLQSLGINRSDYAWNLVNFGIGTKDDFKNYTKKEVLSIDGIGPKTIAKLEEAGIEFKEE